MLLLRGCCYYRSFYGRLAAVASCFHHNLKAFKTNLKRFSLRLGKMDVPDFRFKILAVQLHHKGANFRATVDVDSRGFKWFKPACATCVRSLDWQQ